MIDAALPPTSTVIASLNDAFRQAGPNGDWYATIGVTLRGAVFVALAFRAVMSFTDFTEDNDPYGERDFGAIMLDGVKLFWKIDCYDQTMQWASPDPTDPTQTRRVITIMRASEY